MTGPNRGPLTSVLPRIEEATRALTDARCEVVAFHCTANSMEEGRGGEERILAAMKPAGAPQATTTATAIRRAFDALGARRIVLVTPYDQRTTDHEAEFLHEAGYQVLHAIGFALDGSDAYCATPPSLLARPRARGRAARCRRLFRQLREHLGLQRDRGAGARARSAGRHQQPGGGVGLRGSARLAGSRRLSRAVCSGSARPPRRRTHPEQGRRHVLLSR